MSLRTRILLLVLLATVAPAAAFGFYFVRDRDQDIDEAKRNLGVLARYPQYSGLLTIAPDGELHCDSLRTARTLNVSGRAYFKQIVASLQPAYHRHDGHAAWIGRRAKSPGGRRAARAAGGRNTRRTSLPVEVEGSAFMPCARRRLVAGVKSFYQETT